ncbi:cyclase [Actinacidiphila yanglinensis]|uniref:Cyclase n=1 Tax=Actinacidiphila yanglinensis TaxID=310779 RepID=A0A1H6E8D1_9ACTN|nr:MBL fold metallo-hydrolase [Actinacidiphila yanglinensis]SEG93513.1 cyclase [Actinacidiphila yanglinensis]
MSITTSSTHPEPTGPPGPSGPPDPPTPPSPIGLDALGVEEVAPGVHAFVQPDGSWCLSNAGVLPGEDVTVVVDTAATIGRAGRLREEADRLRGDSRMLVVNTHQHGDHTFGNCLFARDALFVAHDTARTDMAESGLGLQQLWPDVEWGPVEVTLPQVTYSDRMTIHRADGPVELIHPGPAHTLGDTVVWLPRQRVLFTGDIAMNGVTPFCLMGSVEGSLRTIRSLLALRPEVVVPGHGPVCGPEVFDTCARYLHWVQRLAEEALTIGRSPLEAARRADLGEWADLLDSERLVANLVRSFAEQRGGPLGERIDEMGAFRDMVQFHGGLPVCHA